nr:hypothetical protein [Tanacetum cinerariifolium]
MCQSIGWDAQTHGWMTMRRQPTNRRCVLGGWRGFGIPRVSSWTLFYNYNIEETLKNKIKYEYLHDDEDIFINYTCERALSIYEDVYPEWCLEFFSTMYFDRGVDRTKLMMEKCIWFRLSEVKKQGEISKKDMWIMSALEESRGINLAWVIVKHHCKHALGLKENSLMCGGHYVTNIAHSLGYLNDDEVAKCSEPIEYETWTIKMLVNELDGRTYSLIQTEHEAPEHGQARRQSQEQRHSAPILHHLVDQSNYAYPAYEPPNVPPYPYPYVPYPYPYTHYPDTSSPSFGGDHYGAHADSYHAGSIVPSSLYEIGGSGYKYHPLHVISYPLDQIRTDLSYVEEPKAILDHQDRVMRKKTIPFVKILWRNHPEREAT